MGPKPRRAPAADAIELADHLLDALGGLHGRGDAQHVADQAADGLADRGGIRAGLGGVDKDLEGLVLAVLVDGDEGFPERGFHREGVAHQVARARLLGPLPEHGLLGGGCRGAGLGVDHGGVGFLC